MEQSKPRDPLTTTHRREEIGLWIASAEMRVCWRYPSPSGPLILELDLLANDFAELLVGLCGLEPAVEVDSGLDVSVPKQALNGFVGAWIVPQVDRCRSVAELVNGEPQADCDLNAPRDLTTEHACCFRLPGHAWKQECAV